MTYFASSRRAQDDLKVTERVTSQILSLPIYETLTDQEIDMVVNAIATAHDRVSRPQRAGFRIA